MKGQVKLILMAIGVFIGTIALILLLSTIKIEKEGITIDTEEFGRFVGILGKRNASYVGNMTKTTTTTTTSTTTTIPIIKIIAKELCNIAKYLNLTNVTYGNLTCYRYNETCRCIANISNETCYINDIMTCIKVLK